MNRSTANPISISIAPTTRIVGKRYIDLPDSIELMQRLHDAKVVDGFELQNLAEWDARCPPRDERQKRHRAWTLSEKHTTDEIADHLTTAGLPILSVHANRDVGICLCSGEPEEIEQGEVLIHEALHLTERLGAQVCVFHLWDTWKDAFDAALLQETLEAISAHHPGVRAAVENVPTHLPGRTPLDLLRAFRWITLDLRWAALYDELEAFAPLHSRIANVHLRGRLAGGQWELADAPFGFYQALDLIRREWGYTGLLTMEPEGLAAGQWDDLARAMASLRTGSETPGRSN